MKENKAGQDDLRFFFLPNPHRWSNNGNERKFWRKKKTTNHTNSLFGRLISMDVPEGPTVVLRALPRACGTELGPPAGGADAAPPLEQGDVEEGSSNGDAGGAEQTRGRAGADGVTWSISSNQIIIPSRVHQCLSNDLFLYIA